VLKSMSLRNVRLRLVLLSLFTIVFLLSGCGVRVIPVGAPAEDPGRPVSSDDPTPALPVEVPIEGEVVSGQAMVEEIQILMLESFPVQVVAVVSGYLPDGCTRLTSAEVEQEDDTFVVTLSTVRPADAMCTMALVPFEESITLPVHGLEAGDYTVVANGVSATFTLDVDNILDEE
jgi:inhibitor of cysteine peptidase